MRVEDWAALIEVGVGKEYFSDEGIVDFDFIFYDDFFYLFHERVLFFIHFG